MNETSDDQGFLMLIWSVVLVIILYLIGYTVERYYSNEIVYEDLDDKPKEEVFKCNERIIYKYFWDENCIIDLNTGKKYNTMNDCKEI